MHTLICRVRLPGLIHGGKHNIDIRDPGQLLEPLDEIARLPRRRRIDDPWAPQPMESPELKTRLPIEGHSSGLPELFTRLECHHDSTDTHLYVSLHFWVWRIQAGLEDYSLGTSNRCKSLLFPDIDNHSRFQECVKLNTARSANCVIPWASRWRQHSVSADLDQRSLPSNGA